MSSQQLHNSMDCVLAELAFNERENVVARLQGQVFQFLHRREEFHVAFHPDECNHLTVVDDKTVFHEASNCCHCGRGNLIIFQTNRRIFNAL